MLQGVWKTVEHSRNIEHSLDWVYFSKPELGMDTSRPQCIAKIQSLSMHVINCKKLNSYVYFFKLKPLFVKFIDIFNG